MNYSEEWHLETARWHMGQAMNFERNNDLVEALQYYENAAGHYEMADRKFLAGVCIKDATRCYKNMKKELRETLEKRSYEDV